LVIGQRNNARYLIAGEVDHRRLLVRTGVAPGKDRDRVGPRLVPAQRVAMRRTVTVLPEIADRIGERKVIPDSEDSRLRKDVQGSGEDAGAQLFVGQARKFHIKRGKDDQPGDQDRGDRDEHNPGIAACQPGRNVRRMRGFRL
jgi:hypothetical protein